MAKLLYQGHASFRITTDAGKVAYIDPYIGEGYDLPADVVLVTHQHGDHNCLKLITQNPGCVVITNAEALAGGKHHSFSVAGLEIEAVEAKNFNHSPKKCVGYVITVDGVTLYHAGDTSRTAQMDTFAARAFDYALLPCDGVFNMGLDEAAACAGVIAAAHAVPIHMKPGAAFDRKRAEKFDAPNRLILEPGQEIELTGKGTLA